MLSFVINFIVKGTTLHNCNNLTRSEIAINKRRAKIHQIFNSNSEYKNKICNAIEKLIKENRENIPPNLKKIIDSENGIKIIQESYIGLTTRSKKRLRLNDLSYIFRGVRKTARQQCKRIYM